MKVKYKNSVIEITNESDLDSAEFGQRFKKQYPAGLGIESEYKPSSKHGIRITENGIKSVAHYCWNLEEQLEFLKIHF